MQRYTVPKKCSEDDKRKIDDAVQAVKEALKGSDASAMKSGTERLNEAWQAVSSNLYKAASEQAQAGRGAGAGPQQGRPGTEQGGRQEEGDVVEAEIVDDKDQKA